MSAIATRVVAVAVTGTAVLASTVAVGAVRERSALPVAAHRLLQATIVAGDVTTCLGGARDELYLPGVPRLHDPGAVHAALTRLRQCDVDALAHAVAAVHLPPAAPLTDRARRQARAAIVTGVAELQRVVLDARGARTAMMANAARAAADGTTVVLAYRSAAAGSDQAYAEADQALALLGEPQSTVNG